MVLTSKRVKKKDELYFCIKILSSCYTLVIKKFKEKKFLVSRKFLTRRSKSLPILF